MHHNSIAALLLAVIPSCSAYFSYGNSYNSWNYGNGGYYGGGGSYYNQPRYSSSNDYQDFTYLNGFETQTIYLHDLDQAALSSSVGTAPGTGRNIYDNAKGFKVRSLTFYWGLGHIPSKNCADSGTSTTKGRVKRAASATSTTPKYNSNTGRASAGYDSESNGNWTSPQYTSPSFYNGNYTTPPGGNWSEMVEDYYNENGQNKTTGGDLLYYMSLFFTNYSNKGEVLQNIQEFLPANFTRETFNNASDLIKYVNNTVPDSVRKDVLALMAGGGLGALSGGDLNQWINVVKTQQTYNNLMNGASNQTGPVQFDAGCSQTTATAVCSRPISDFDLDDSYVFTKGTPTEIAWECTGKGEYCCKWECCKKKGWNAARIVMVVVFCLLILSCFCCICCFCIMGKKKREQQETLTNVAIFYPRRPAYTIPMPPRAF